MGGNSNNVICMDSLILELGDDDPRIRAKACTKMARAGDAAVPSLTQTVCGANPLARGAASNALVQIGRKVVPALVGQIRSRLEVQERIPDTAIWALGSLIGRDPSELTRLVRMLDKQTDHHAIAATHKLLAAWNVDDENEDTPTD